MAEFAGGFGNGGSSTRDVLFLVPQLFLLVFMAAMAVDSCVGLVDSLCSGEMHSRPKAAHTMGSGAHLRRPLAAWLCAAALTVLLTLTTGPTLLLSLRVVLDAPVAVVVMAATAAVATVVLGLVASVVLVATVLVAVGASAVVLARIYGSITSDDLEAHSCL